MYVQKNSPVTELTRYVSKIKGKPRATSVTVRLDLLLIPKNVAAAKVGSL